MNEEVQRDVSRIGEIGKDLRVITAGGGAPPPIEEQAAELERIAGALRRWRDAERERLGHRRAGRRISDSEIEDDVKMIDEIHDDLTKIAGNSRRDTCNDHDVEMIGVHADSLEYVADRLRRWQNSKVPDAPVGAPA